LATAIVLEQSFSFNFIRLVSMLNTIEELEKFLDDEGITKGNPLIQNLDSARSIQHQYLNFLKGEFFHRSTTKFYKLHGPYGLVNISITYPSEQATAIPIVYIRGGGWWNGSLELSSRLVQVIADASGMPVVCVDFGLAPHFQFPSQIHQISSAIDWLSKYGTSFDLDGCHCVMWGESAGSSLALCVSDTLDKNFPKLFVGHVLFYGNFNGPTEITTSYSKWVWSNYLGNCEPKNLSQAIPLKTQLRGIQRAWLSAGSKDPLIHDSELLQKALIKKNIACELEIVENMPHGFISCSRLLNPAYYALLRGAKKAFDFSQTVEQVNTR
jgi:acetyl esterase